MTKLFEEAAKRVRDNYISHVDVVVMSRLYEAEQGKKISWDEWIQLRLNSYERESYFHRILQTTPICCMCDNI